MEGDLKQLKESTSQLVAEDEMKEVEETARKCKQERAKKRKACLEILDMISEGMDKSPKELLVLFPYTEIRR